MPTRDTPFTPGTPCWVDLLTSDPDASRAFYDALFGWTSTSAGEDFGGYVTFASDGHRVAGLIANDPSFHAPDCWNTYISTADIEATVQLALGAGGVLGMPVSQVADLGSMAMLSDATGGTLGLWQPGTHTGFGKYNEPGSVTWDEYHSKDFAASVDFYTAVFGWTWDKTGDSDDFRYYTASANGDVVAGIMDSSGFLPPDVPSHWDVYFSVAIVDESVARAVQLGASVVRPAEDTPFGRLVELTDVTGASLKLHSTENLPTA